MERSLIRTEDGSSSLYVPQLKEHYHSIHGAIQESFHIFIREGLSFYNRKDISVLEAGFGTGLNAYLALIYAEKENCPIRYTSLEKYPLTPSESRQLNYKDSIPFEKPELFDYLHTVPWNEPIKITSLFTLHKREGDFREADLPSEADIVFFDAFSPDVQPYLWTEEVFCRFFEALKPGGILVTYCVKGTVKRALRKCGFLLRKLPGPPGKREILRATRPLKKEKTDE